MAKNEKIWTKDFLFSLPSVVSGKIKILDEIANQSTLWRHSKINVEVNGKQRVMSFRAIKEHNMSVRTEKIRNVAYKIDEAKRIIESYGHKLLSDSIKNVNTHLEIECSSGHRFKRTLSKFNSGQTKCPHCQNKTETSKINCPYGFWTNERFDILLEKHLPKHTRISNVSGALVKVTVKCPKGHYYQKSPDVFFNAIDYKGKVSGCPRCQVSIFEEWMSKLLLENNIAFKTQESFSNTVISSKGGCQRFDFYLPEYNLCIECDGHFHFSKETIKSKGFKIPTGNFSVYYEECKERDRTKDLYCVNNNVSLLRIPYFVMNSKSKLLELLQQNFKGVSCLI